MPRRSRPSMASRRRTAKIEATPARRAAGEKAASLLPAIERARSRKICVVTPDPLRDRDRRADRREIDPVAGYERPPDTASAARGRRRSAKSKSRRRPWMMSRARIRRTRLLTGRVDLGALTAEFLSLGLDPYPEKPGVEFEDTRGPAGAGGEPPRPAGRLEGEAGPRG